MIPQRYIQEWKEQAPWPTDAQVEQDLVIARALVELFSDKLINKSLAFRGGTALHKLYLQPQIRYSEDIDLVQINSEPIVAVLKRIREKLASFLGTKRTVNKFQDDTVENPPTEKQFLANMEEKMKDKEFFQDIHSILRPEVVYDNLKAWEVVRKELIEKL